MKTDTLKTQIYRKDYTPSAFLIDTVDLIFELASDNTLVRNTMQVRRNPKAMSEQALTLNGTGIELQAVYLNQKLLTSSQYQCTETNLIILDVPDQFELRVDTVCHPKANTALEGLYLSNHIFCTQCEPHGFRHITYYLDRPDVMAKFTTTLIADAKQYPVMLSNGNCIADETLPDQRRKLIWQDPFKKPCYLFAIVAGKLDCLEDFFITQSNRKICLRIFVETGNQSKALHAMAMLKKAMRWDEEYYGREYDLDIFMIVAVADFNMGAMENKGLNIFNAKYILADAETATDVDYEGIATVVAHEYFHNWTGNRITCQDWFQLSLKEGLTVFRDQEFTAEVTPKTVVRIDDVRALRTAQFTEDAGPLAHPVRPDAYLEMNNFYTATVYNKGAELIRMLHTLEGAAGYRKGMDLYFDRFDGMAVTCDDFIQAHADANQRDYSQFLRWYAQAGTPTLNFSDHYDTQTKKYTLTVTQETLVSADGSSKEPFHIPIRMACFDKKTGEKLVEQVFELTQVTQIFEINHVMSAPLPSLMRGFSAPVRWHYPYSLQDQIFLLAHDDDCFNRFEMSQQIYNYFFQKQADQLPAEYLNALQHILLDEKIEDAVKSRLLSVPSYRELCAEQKSIQVEQTIVQRKKMNSQIACALAESACQILKKLMQHQEDYHFNAEAVGMRSLRATCLRLLFEAGDAEAISECEALYQHANNMTDRFNALSLLTMYADQAAREKALADFYQRFAGDALVVEKWLSLHASTPQYNTLNQVKALMQHPAFEFKNPNKVRALIGAFSQNNFEGFHLADGSGYEFLADQVLALDKINPQIAARMVEPLTRFRHYADSHLVLMRSALQRIAQEKNLSPGLFEIVHKSVSE